MDLASIVLSSALFNSAFLLFAFSAYYKMAVDLSLAFACKIAVIASTLALVYLSNSF